MEFDINVINLNDDGDIFYTIQNRDGKKWSFSAKNLRTSFEIYEPSGIKGIFLKKANFLLKFNLIRNILAVRTERISIKPELQKFLSPHIGDNSDFSIFFGTPSSDRKITIQFFDNERILCYCKIGKSNRVKKLFEKEIKLLTFLHEKGILHVPYVLTSGIVNDYYVFAQSTEKTMGSKILHEMGKSHTKFLDCLYRNTVNCITYESTDYYELINSCAEKLNMLSDERRSAIIATRNKINQRYINKTVSWGVVHGDFTPWNTCQVNNDTFVFDFEYGLFNAPREIDDWHFLIQSLIFEKKMSIQDVVKFILKKAYDMKAFEEYITFYVFTYLKRGQPDDIEQINMRVDILSGVNKLKGVK